jgi:hypothetical protein
MSSNSIKVKRFQELVTPKDYYHLKNVIDFLTKSPETEPLKLHNPLSLLL